MLENVTQRIFTGGRSIRKTLKRQLGVFDLFCIASGAMISSGLFVLPAIVFAVCGPAVVLAYLFASLMVVPAILSQAELVTAMPRAGGTYFFLDRSLGRGVGLFSGLANWFSLGLKSAFALIGMGLFAKLVYPDLTDLQIKLAASGLCLLFVLINLFSLKLAARFQKALVLFLLPALFLYFLAGARFVDVQLYTPFFSKGTGMMTLFAAAGMVFISFGGVTKIAGIAEEAKNPNRNIPLGMILAFLVTSLLYLLVVFVTVGILAPEELINSPAPISSGARIILGKTGFYLLTAAALAAFVTTANAGILSASRYPMAMSRDKLLPEFFRTLSYRFGTPHYSIAATGFFIIISIIALPLEDLVKTASALMIMLFMLVNVAVIIMRESGIQSYRPSFKTPLYPWTQILGVVLYVWLIINMGSVPLAISAAFIGVAAVWYYVYARPRGEPPSALVHVLERILPKALAGGELESELRDILIERDNIVEDHFDEMIKTCPVIDCAAGEDGSPMSLEEVFGLIVPPMAESLDEDPDLLMKLFTERESESSTVIAKGLAIPHILVEGQGKFQMMVVRCSDGVKFPSSPDPVHTLFVLAGSSDERNFHLRALAAIAQIAQDPAFDRYWLKAKRSDELRNILLLSERKRIGVI